VIRSHFDLFSLGLLFGLPVVLDVNHTRDDIKPGSKVALNYKGQFIATLDVESRFEPNKAKETKMCYGNLRKVSVVTNADFRKKN